MAQATITLKMTPIEFQVFQEAMIEYMAVLSGDDTGSKYRKRVAQSMLGEMGAGVIPAIRNNGQSSFDERGRIHRFDDFEDDDEPEEEEAPGAEDQAGMEEAVEMQEAGEVG